MEAIVSSISVGTILGAPLLHQWGSSFGFVENGLVRLLIIVFVAYATRQGAMPGLLAFLAAFTLLIERNHEVLTSFPNQRPRWPKNSFGRPVQAAPLVGEEEIAHYEPPHYEHENEAASKEIVELRGDTTITRAVESADDLKDNNPRLEGPPPNDAAPGFFTQKNLL